VLHAQRGAPAEIVNLVSASDWRGKSIRNILKYLREEKAVSLTTTEVKQLRYYKAAQKRKAVDTAIAADLRGTFGELQQLGELNTRAALVSRDEFTEHTPYVLGEVYSQPPSEAELQAAQEANDAARQLLKVNHKYYNSWGGGGGGGGA
jgi:hypothetical protein